jgi:hypothetical protein
MKSLTRGRAIHQMCKECLYDPIGGRGTWVQQAEACTRKICPLFPYRPKSRASATVRVQNGL